MHRFRIGQKVVALYNHSLGRFKKGDEFTVESLTCCPSCGTNFIILSELKKIVNSECNGKRFSGCGFTQLRVRQRYNEICFAPLQNNADAIEYRLNVSIKELEVKEYQNQ